MRHNIEVVVDRLVAGPKIRARLAEAVELALKLGEGNLIVAREPGGQPPGEAGWHADAASKGPAWPPGLTARGCAASDIHLSAHYACTHCRLSFEPPSPQLFSFNSPQGMCPTCNGLGEIYSFDPELLVPDPSKSFQQGCDRAGRRLEGDGALAAAHLPGRGRGAGAQVRPGARHDAGNRLGRA